MTNNRYVLPACAAMAAVVPGIAVLCFFGGLVMVLLAAFGVTTPV